MKTPMRIASGDAKNSLSDLQARVERGGERFILTWYGKPRSALVSPEDLEALRLAEDLAALPEAARPAAAAVAPTAVAPTSREKWMLLAADFLDMAADRFMDDTCAEWKFPDSWTRAERVEAVAAWYNSPGSPGPDERDPGEDFLDHWRAMQLMADFLRQNHREGEGKCRV